MRTATAVLMAGLGMTCSLLAEDLAPEVAVVRCESEPSGAITVRNWSVTDYLRGIIEYQDSCAETVASLLGKGLKLSFGPRVTTFSPTNREVSYSFVFLSDASHVPASNRAAEDGAAHSEPSGSRAGFDVAQDFSARDLGKREGTELLDPLRAARTPGRTGPLDQSSERGAQGETRQPGKKRRATEPADTSCGADGSPPASN